MPLENHQYVFRIAIDRVTAIGIRVTEGALTCAREMDCQWMVETAGPFTPNVLKIDHCLGICGLFNKELVESGKLQSTSFPVINLSNRWGPLNGIGNFLSDDLAIGRRAATHLLSRGYKHFLLVGELSKQFVEDRISGFRSCLGELNDRCEVIKEDFLTAMHTQSLQSFIHQTEEELRPVFQRVPMDLAVFATNDWLAGLLQRVLMQHYPERIHTTAVLGVDDEQHAWWYLGRLAELSSVRPAFHEMGATAMKLLVENPGDREAILQEKTRRFLPEKVAMRASTAGGACADPVTARITRWAWQSMQEGYKVQVSDLATQFKMSRRTLERRFGVHLGLGVGDFLRAQRLDMAVHLLRSTNMTMAEISQRCGYSKQDTLSTIFRNTFDKTPVEFRREAQSNQQ